MMLDAFKEFQQTLLYKNLLANGGSPGCLWTAFYEGGKAMEFEEKAVSMKYLRRRFG